MARRSVADGVRIVACTPHILQGVYANAGPDIRQRVEQLQAELNAAHIDCRLVCGSDAHVSPDLVDGLQARRILSLNDSRYVLVEPPHHILPPNMDRFFFDLLAAGYVPILTHPERMFWADANYGLLRHLVRSDAWMQLTAGSIVGRFRGEAKSRSERMLRDGMVHVVASDAPSAAAPVPPDKLDNPAENAEPFFRHMSSYFHAQLSRRGKALIPRIRRSKCSQGAAPSERA